MAKEIRTFLWCDGAIHEEHDEQVEALSTHHIVIDRLDRELDLCELCEKEVLGELIELLRANGQPVGKKPAGQKSAAAVAPTPGVVPSTAIEPEPDGGFKCPECDGGPYKSIPGLGRHRQAKHGIAGGSGK